ncbi:hypothetical protein AYR66_22355 [Noviherbaspirillum denitrificans]|uniref:Uncharacterized protein n=1 Tax=Noviherbaspirillum denitrificans TaxID=1968433 RepID=A0A254TGP7_9BURK|nr:hypothetical protein AYR66_22355 [Noviherbaspirillum denitrificans]
MVRPCKDQSVRAKYAMQRMIMAQTRMLVSMNSSEEWERAYKWAAAWGVASQIARTCAYTDTCIHRSYCSPQPPDKKLAK